MIEALERAGVRAPRARARRRLRRRRHGALAGRGGRASRSASTSTARFRGSGTRLPREKGIAHAGLRAGRRRSGCRSATARFDLVFSHSVIEHVASARARTCASATACCGRAACSTSRPRPTSRWPARTCRACWCRCRSTSLLGRRLAFRAFCWLARHAPWTLQERKEANTFIALAEQGREKEDDLLQRVTRAPAARAGSARPGFRLRARGPPRDRLLPPRRCPGRCAGCCERTPFAQDVMIGHVQCVLEKRVSAARRC